MLIEGKKATAWPIALGLLILLAIFFLVRSLFFEIFWVPSASMEPTVLSRELILTSKFQRNFSGATARSFQRGDLVVFKSVEDNGTYILKRLIAQAGDHVRVDPDLGLFINDDLITQKTVHGLYSENWQGREVLVSWNFPTAPWEMEVPKGYFIAMGDNRSQSVDSRVWGPVPVNHLVGHVRWVLWSCREREGYRTPGCGLEYLRKHRLGVHPGGKGYGGKR